MSTESTLKQLVNGFAGAALLTDAQGILLVANLRARALFPALMEGRLVSGVIRNSEFQDSLQQVLEGGRSTDLAFVLRKPSKRHLGANIIGIDGEGGERFVFIHLRDREEEENLARMRMNFIASASHELRTPLASLVGFIETLQGAAKDDPAAREQFLEIMAAQAQRMQRLLDDLLSLSRIEMEAHAVPADIVDMNALAERAAETMCPQAQERGVTLKLIREAGRATVRGNADQLEQVAQNLISNAITYGGDGGEVRIRVRALPADRRHGPRVAFSVRDFGPGIAKEHIPHLTERFYRVDKEASRNRGGTGLGLAIVKHLVQAHRGTLKIRSKPGQGAKFTVEIPAAEA